MNLLARDRVKEFHRNCVCVCVCPGFDAHVLMANGDAKQPEPS